MTRGSKKRRIERLKSALIVLLSCSAVFLLVRTQAAIVSSEDSGTAYQAEAEGSSSTESPGATARPLRMAAAIQRGSEVVRYGVQYDQESTDSLYQQSYSLLVEALSSASQPRAVGETEFQQALSTAPGLYFDWQGEIPVTDGCPWTARPSPGRCGGWCLRRWRARCSCTIGMSRRTRAGSAPRT